jgi:hypothetical protein
MQKKILKILKTLFLSRQKSNLKIYFYPVLLKFYLLCPPKARVVSSPIIKKP